MIFKIDRFPINDPKFYINPPVELEQVKVGEKIFLSCQVYNVKTEGINKEDVYKRFYKELAKVPSAKRIYPETEEELRMHECDFCIKSAKSQCKYCHKYLCDRCLCDCYFIPPDES